MNGNEVLEESDVRVGNYISDEINPTLDDFHLDLNRGLLYLSFSETVNVSTFDGSSITIQNDPMDSTVTPSKTQQCMTTTVMFSLYRSLNKIKIRSSFIGI